MEVGVAPCGFGTTSNSFVGVWVESATTWFEECSFNPGSLTLYRTTDAGRAWTVATPCGSDRCRVWEYPPPVAVTANGRWIYVLSQESTGRTVMNISDDDGASWTPLNLPASAAAVADDVTVVPVGADAVDLETDVYGIATVDLAQSTNGGPWGSR